MKKFSINRKIQIEKRHKDYCFKSIKKKIMEYGNQLNEENTDKKKLENFLIKYYDRTIISASDEIPSINKEIGKLDFSEETLKSLTEFYKNAYKNFVNDAKNSLPLNHNTKIESLFNEKWSSRILCFILDVKVCPYCNSSFINSMKATNTKVFYGFVPKGTIKPTIDHFYPKSVYSYFTMSLYNLIPSCYNCNSLIKGNKEFLEEFSMNPYEESVDDWLEFFIKIGKDELQDSYSILTGNSLDYEISYKPKSIAFTSKEHLRNYVKAMYMLEFFHILEQYQYHKGFLSNQIKKKLIYTNSYVEELKTIYEIDMSYDIYESKEDINKLLLGKLIKDVFNKIDYEDRRGLTHKEIINLFNKVSDSEKEEVLKYLKVIDKKYK